jgi:hypothetical protein
VYWSSGAFTGDVLPPTVTRTSTTPEPPGVVAVHLVGVQLIPGTTVLPKWKSVAPSVLEKPEPVMVTTVPAGPEFGVTLVTPSPEETVL